MGEKIDAIKGFLFENVLSVVSEQGKDILKRKCRTSYNKRTCKTRW